MDNTIEKLEKRISFMEQKIVELQKDNLNYLKERENVNQVLHDMCNINNEVMISVSKIIGDQTTLDVNQNITKARCDNLKYELFDPALNRGQYYFPVIRSCEETIDEIINGRKSMARFGDGEFAQIAKIYRHKFQRLDDKLADRLEEVLHSHHPNILIAIANNYGSLEQYTQFAADGIRFYMTAEEGKIRKQHMDLLEHDRIYYDAYVSRPYVMYKDNMTGAPKKRFEHLKKIWKDRKVIIVEGAQTRMGVGNDLLEGAQEIKRILAPATSSFDRYDDILKAALENAEDDTLFLVAMGPSAGVLAYDLAVQGYQALDIGHIDLEYEWFLAGKGERVPVRYKYNNELAGDDNAKELHDPEYESQIIAKCI